MKEKIHAQFVKRFGANGTFYASAGRINLIGEHTDYIGGFVFPGAIDKGMMAEIRLNGTDKVRVYSVDLDDYAEFGFAEADAPADPGPATYSEYAGRPSRGAATCSRALTPPSQATCPSEQACPPRPPSKAPSHLP